MRIGRVRRRKQSIILVARCARTDQYGSVASCDGLNLIGAGEGIAQNFSDFQILFSRPTAEISAL
jgi:hypothetical protein